MRYRFRQNSPMTERAGLSDFRVVRHPGKEKGFMMWVFAHKPD